jgi:hypothetical protein
VDGAELFCKADGLGGVCSDFGDGFLGGEYSCGEAAGVGDCVRCDSDSCDDEKTSNSVDDEADENLAIDGIFEDSSRLCRLSHREVTEKTTPLGSRTDSLVF